MPTKSVWKHTHEHVHEGYRDCYTEHSRSDTIHAHEHTHTEKRGFEGHPHGKKRPLRRVEDAVEEAKS